MPYDYTSERSAVFTEYGQKMFLEIRDRAKRLIEQAGSAKLSNIIQGTCGDSWHMIACVDRLVELGELREIKQTGYVAGQNRIFVGA